MAVNMIDAPTGAKDGRCKQTTVITASNRDENVTITLQINGQIFYGNSERGER
jgi:hypothetical protein